MQEERLESYDEEWLESYNKKWFDELSNEYDDFSGDVIKDILNDDNYADPYNVAIEYVYNYVGDYAVSQAMVSYLIS